MKAPTGDVAVQEVKTRTRPVTRLHRRTRIFLGLSGGLLLIVLVGFARTFYLRAFIDVPDIPAYVLLHGSVLTAWFAGVFLQSLLVNVQRTDLHRRFGWSLCGVAVATFAMSLYVTLAFIPRLRGLGVDIERDISGLSGVLWTDVVALIDFAVFVSAAILMRRRPEFHKRLMILASISIVSPAMTRLWRLSMFDVLSAAVPGSMLSYGALTLLLLVLGLYDFMSSKRIHPVTLAGAGLFMSLRILAMFGVANSEWGQSFVRALR